MTPQEGATTLGICESLLYRRLSKSGIPRHERVADKHLTPVSLAYLGLPQESRVENSTPVDAPDFAPNSIKEGSAETERHTSPTLWNDSEHREAVVELQARLVWQEQEIARLEGKLYDLSVILGHVCRQIEGEASRRASWRDIAGLWGQSAVGWLAAWGDEQRVTGRAIG